MSAESDMRRVIVKALWKLDAFSVENPANPGTPDVNFIEGWIELKVLEKWPIRTKTLVRISHFTQQQRTRLMARQVLGGNVFLLLKVNQEWLLFDGKTAAIYVGRVTKRDLIDRAAKHWSNGLVTEELIECLKKTSQTVRSSTYSESV